MDRDQADRLFARERAESFLYLAGGEPKAAATDQVDADEIAVGGARCVGLGNVELAPGLLLVDGNEPSAAIGKRAEYAEHAGLGVIDHLDDASAIDGACAVFQLLDPQQRAVADACRGARLRTAGNMDADFWRLAAFDLVPFGRSGDQLAVAVASGDVGHHGRRQHRRFAYLLAALLNGAFVGKLAQDSLQFHAVGILQAEFAGDLLRSDFSGIGSDKGDNGISGRKAIVMFSLHLPSGLSCAFLGGRLGGGRSLRRGSLRSRRDRRPRLADGIGFRLAGGLLHGGLFRDLGRVRCARSGFCRRCLGRRRFDRFGFLSSGLAAALGGAFVDQRDGFRQA